MDSQTFSWTTACSPNKITFPGAETKNESIQSKQMQSLPLAQIIRV